MTISLQSSIPLLQEQAYRLEDADKTNDIHHNSSYHTKQKDKLKDLKEVSAESIAQIPKLAVDAAMTHLKDQSFNFGHQTVSSKRELSNLGESIFSVLFSGTKAPRQINQPPETDSKFMTMIEEIERYMYQIVAMPNNENELHEDMRKHKKFIQESADDLEFLEKYFGILKLSPSAIINFKKLRPVVLPMDASGEGY